MSGMDFKTIHGNEYGTPQWLFDSLNDEFGFTWDLACTKENKKAPNGLHRPECDSLKEDWHKLDGWLWLNPPYSPLKPWVQKAQSEHTKGAKIVLLIPPVISARYFSDVPPSQIRFIKGRVPFILNGREMKGNNQDSCLVIYGPAVKTDIVYVERDAFKRRVFDVFPQAEKETYAQQATKDLK